MVIFALDLQHTGTPVEFLWYLVTRELFQYYQISGTFGAAMLSTHLPNYQPIPRLHMTLLLDVF